MPKKQKIILIVAVITLWLCLIGAMVNRGSVILVTFMVVNAVAFIMVCFHKSIRIFQTDIILSDVRKIILLLAAIILLITAIAVTGGERGLFGVQIGVAFSVAVSFIIVPPSYNLPVSKIQPLLSDVAKSYTEIRVFLSRVVKFRTEIRPLLFRAIKSRTTWLLLFMVLFFSLLNLVDIDRPNKEENNLAEVLLKARLADAPPILIEPQPASEITVESWKRYASCDSNTFSQFDWTLIEVLRNRLEQSLNIKYSTIPALYPIPKPDK